MYLRNPAAQLNKKIPPAARNRFVFLKINFMKTQFYIVIIQKLIMPALIFIVCNTIKAQNKFPSTGASGYRNHSS
jgi:hypothetical protein